MLNETHDPARRSWAQSANDPSTDFPLQNLPFGVCRPRGSSAEFRACVAVGDQVLDVSAARDAGAFEGDASEASAACAGGRLNGLMALGPRHWSALRLALFRGLSEGSPDREALAKCLAPRSGVECGVPARIGDFTDFFASIHHARRAGSISRPENPLLPNYHWVPIAYHGRASSIRVSGTDVIRPHGQIKPDAGSPPLFAPTRRLDYELELGFYVGGGNALGTRISMADADRHMFGVSLLNDWSARDMQAWEAQPLGPFLAKSFLTTISPWIVTFEALEPFRLPWRRITEAGEPLPYLSSKENDSRGALDIQVEASLMVAGSGALAGGRVLSRTSARHAHWTMAQMLVHHSSNGCDLSPGDLIGTGTQSGPTIEEAGCLLELSEGGRKPIDIGGGSRRTFLENGDTVILKAWCESGGRRRIGFGDCVSTVRPAN